MRSLKTVLKVVLLGFSLCGLAFTVTMYARSRMGFGFGFGGGHHGWDRGGYGHGPSFGFGLYPDRSEVVYVRSAEASQVVVDENALLTKRINTQKREIASLKSDLKFVRSERDNLLKEVNKHEKVVERLELKHEKELSRLEAKIVKLEKKIEKLRDDD